MTSKQRTWGQFATPTDVADLLLGFCLRRAADRLLDPSCGDGALLRRATQWQSWLDAGQERPAGTLHGIELDPDAATAAAAIPGATVEQANFFMLTPDAYPPFDVVVGNPPYTRAEWINRLDTGSGQMALFPETAAGDSGDTSAPLLPVGLGDALSGRAGLYAYFFLHSLGFLREGGRLGFVVPNGWLDVAYGDALKQFILDHFRVIAVVESAVERWFATARVNTCLIILERAGDPAARDANRVRFARLRRPLSALLGPETDSRRAVAVEQLIMRLLPPDDRQTPGALLRVREQSSLAAAERWGALSRTPVFFQHLIQRPVAPLGEWASVQRGHTTGANDFFILDPNRIERWGIEPRYRRPLLKSLRGVRSLRLSAADCRHELLAVPAGEQPEGGAADYLAWGEAQGIAARPTCAGRNPWYALPEQTPGAVLLAKGVWQRHFAPLAEEPITVDQQIYRVILNASAISPRAAAALLNSVWFALACELGGRVNLGEGVLWLASYELADVVLPDPRALDAGAIQALETAFDGVAALPVADTPAALWGDARRALDDLVFDLAGLPPPERDAAREALIEALDGRRHRARHPVAQES